jgi:ParB-like nuclease domain
VFGSKTKSGNSTPFRRHLNGMPDVGQGTGWLASQWRQAPTRRIRLTDLIATNLAGYLDEARVARYLKSSGHGEPYVVEHRGHLYVADGHHRATAAYRRGETHIRARVMRPA